MLSDCVMNENDGKLRTKQILIRKVYLSQETSNNQWKRNNNVQTHATVSCRIELFYHDAVTFYLLFQLPFTHGYKMIVHNNLICTEITKNIFLKFKCINSNHKLLWFCVVYKWVKINMKYKMETCSSSKYRTNSHHSYTNPEITNTVNILWMNDYQTLH